MSARGGGVQTETESPCAGPEEKARTTWDELPSLDLRSGYSFSASAWRPCYAAPTVAQETDLHFISELPDGSNMEGEPLEVGLDTWWKRHDTAYQPGIYEIVDDPVNEGSAHSLHLAIDAGVADPEDHARVISYFQAAE